jgi:hypothetical protein
VLMDVMKVTCPAACDSAKRELCSVLQFCAAENIPALFRGTVTQFQEVRNCGILRPSACPSMGNNHPTRLHHFL